MIKMENLATYWLDKDTFCLAFDNNDVDEDGDKYSILCEYHVDDDKYIFARWYEHDVTDTDFTEEQKEYIKKQIMGYMTT